MGPRGTPLPSSGKSSPASGRSAPTSCEAYLRSHPAQKAPPAPQNTATDASGSRSKARNASTSASALSGFTAFRASGREWMTVVTGPLFSTVTAIPASRASLTTGGASPLVVILHQPIEEAHAPARRPALVDLVLGRAHGRTGDVEVRPGRLVDEALEELRRRDGAAVASACVLHVGELRVDELVVGRAERHAPDLLARGLARGRQALRDLVVVREQAGVLLAERDHDGAGERREVDHELRLVALLHVPEEIGEHEPAFRVGVDDLDGLPRHGRHDVARALRGPVGHVLDEADDPDGVDLGLAGSERVHEADDAGRPRHVALHVLHPAARLDGDAARIEDHALADEGDRGGAVLAAVPAHNDDPAVVRRALAHREQRPHAELREGLPVQHLDLYADLGERLRSTGELLRREDVRRLVDEVPRDRHPGSDRLARLDGTPRRSRIGHHEGEARHALFVLPVLRLGLVALELVGPEPRAEDRVGDAVDRVRYARNVEKDCRLPSRDPGPDGPAEGRPVEVLPVLLAPDPDDDQPLDRETLRHRDRQRGLRLALEALEGRQAPDEVAGAPDPGGRP